MAQRNQQSPTRPTGLEKAEKWAVIAAAIMAVIGVVGSSCASYRASLLAERSLRISSRAWISIGGYELDHEPVDGEKIGVRVTVTNTGSTPAVDVITKTRLSVLDEPIEDDWHAAPAGTEAAVVFPGATSNSVAPTLDIPIGTTADYEKGDLHVWITGLITYKDVFGGSHYVQFCATHDASQEPELFSNCRTRPNTIDIDGER